ncbi:permease of the drug/metabolite transporter (DMT) superfamily [Desulforapulum autotrophicum HRM2]|uniref:Permease of the drug/metabolite transporter (DMT) superfamily n=1 Tax=Desulforapulum autotrophicum (strain ATCC 43914 / DSM 3382 / VKM B-1955 / HRM2) TaxID=177437 RepID=C0Q9C1_DESAH|nr:DMT family transporter [Desulforapulum autotrophicum]ACN16626.1 permease of the drug/metabolite transporter (DMT) superfamily [Desulforapulum autotrophicum HRM2]
MQLYKFTAWPHILMLVFTMIIAGSFPVVASITTGIDSVLLTFWRFAAATLIFGIMLPFVKQKTAMPGWKDMGRYATVGGSYGLFFVLMFQSLKTTSPLNTSTIYTTLPLVTMLAGTLVGEPFHLRRLWVLAISMVATVWVIFKGDPHLMLSLDFNRGDLIFFLGTFCLAVYMLSMKKLQRRESKIHFTFYSLFFATLVLMGTAIARTGGLCVPGSHTWPGIAYLAGPSTALTFWILRYTATRLDPTKIVAYTFLTPSAVAVIEWSLGISTPEWSVLPGIGLTLAAVWLLQLDWISKPNGSHPEIDIINQNQGAIHHNARKGNNNENTDHVDQKSHG